MPKVEVEGTHYYREREKGEYEKEMDAFQKDSHLTQEVQEKFKMEALKKCSDLHSKLLDCYEGKYFCGTEEKAFWDCYRRERGFKKTKVQAWAYKLHNRTSEDPNSGEK